jgi:hypothetical protein
VKGPTRGDLQLTLEGNLLPDFNNILNVRVEHETLEVQDQDRRQCLNEDVLAGVENLAWPSWSRDLDALRMR